MIKINIIDLDPAFNIFSEIDKTFKTFIDNQNILVSGLRIFSIMSPTTWDLLYKNRFGNRICSNMMLHSTRGEIATMIYGAFHDKWNKAFETVENYNSKVDSKGTMVRNETITPTTPEVTTKRTTEVSAYDSNELVPDSVETITSNANESYTKTTTVENSNMVSYNEVENIIDRNAIMDMVFNDVNEFLTLQIFESEAI